MFITSRCPLLSPVWCLVFVTLACFSKSTWFDAQSASILLRVVDLSTARPHLASLTQGRQLIEMWPRSERSRFQYPPEWHSFIQIRLADSHACLAFSSSSSSSHSPHPFLRHVHPLSSCFILSLLNRLPSLTPAAPLTGLSIPVLSCCLRPRLASPTPATHRPRRATT